MSKCNWRCSQVDCRSSSERYLRKLVIAKKISRCRFNIYLDGKSLKVYNKVTNKTILEGTYGNPNWVVSLEVMKSSDDLDFEKYSCKARIDSYQELPEQPHKSIQMKSYQFRREKLKRWRMLVM